MKVGLPKCVDLFDNGVIFYHIVVVVKLAAVLPTIMLCLMGMRAILQLLILHSYQESNN